MGLERAANRQRNRRGVLKSGRRDQHDVVGVRSVVCRPTTPTKWVWSSPNYYTIYGSCKSFYLLLRRVGARTRPDPATAFVQHVPTYRYLQKYMRLRWYRSSWYILHRYHIALSSVCRRSDPPNILRLDSQNQIKISSFEYRSIRSSM